MSPHTRLDGELVFSLAEPIASDPSTGDTASESEKMTGRVTANGLDVEIYTSKPELMVQAGTIKLKDLRGVATALAERGLTVSLNGPDGLIVRLGAIKSSLTQRLLTGSSHIKVGSRDAVAPLLRHRSADATTVPAPLLPPLTLLPLAPTFDRRIRRTITTTHYAPGAGRPRLIFVVGSENWNGQMPRQFDLLPGVTTIGSSESADLQLEGLQPLHAEIRHDDNDEYVLYSLGEVGGGARPLPGQDSGSRVLRTGARMEMGQWRMGFFREEYADHGRPYGGRLGGELSYQKSQPSRHRSDLPPSVGAADAPAQSPGPAVADDSEI